MSAVIQKVQLAKSGLTEACSSLLSGFEVRSLIICNMGSMFGKKSRTEDLKKNKIYAGLLKNYVNMGCRLRC